MVEATEQDIKEWIQFGWKIDAEDVPRIEKLVSRAPYYKKAQIVLAKAYHITKDDRFTNQLQKAALCTKDREWLYQYIHSSQEQVDVLKRELTEDKVIDEAAEISSVKVKPLVSPKSKKLKPKEEDPVKIELKLGEGEIVKDVEELEVEARKPKLVVAKKKSPSKNLKSESKEAKKKKVKPKPKAPAAKSSSKKTVVKKKTESKSVKPNEKVSKSPEKLSFLDWLDLSTLEDDADTSNNDDSVKEREGSVLPAKVKNIEKTEEMLAKFLANKPKPGEIKLNEYNPEEKSMISDSGELIPVSETLAKVYIEQNELDLAKRVYEKLMLKIPEKKAYFAALIQEMNN